MKIFIDTANIEQIAKVSRLQIVDGVTTNPSLIAKEGAKLEDVIKKIVNLIDGPISAEVDEGEVEVMFEEAKKLASIDQNIVIKVPMTEDGIILTKMLVAQKIKVNVTLVFSLSQAIIAAKAGATYISPFLGRLDDSYGEGAGHQLLESILKSFKEYNFTTQVIAASIRNLKHVESAIELGCQVATIPYNIIMQMYKHPLTDKGLEIFKQAKNHS